MSHDSYIIDAVRTPIGKLGGALSAVRPDDLAAAALAGLIDRSPSLDPSDIDEVYLGDANQAGEDNRNVARMAVLLSGLPTSVPGATVNRLCGSGLEAVIAASRASSVGDCDIVIAGGVESMSRSPWVLPKPAQGFPTGHEQLWSTTLGWRLVNPRMRTEWVVSLGEGAELLADEFSVSRESQDEFAVASHRRAARAWEAGHYVDEVVAVDGVDLTVDESIRPDSTVERLAALRPVFRPQRGTVTAGNASPMNDGASMLLVTSRAGVDRIGRAPMVRIVSAASSAIEPQRYGIGPVEAAERALSRAGVGWGDLSAVELNEAFAAQALACLKSWPQLDPAIVNPQGGALSIGHPLGASGARILTTLVHHLRRSGGRYGMAAMCIGVGQGIAVIVENLDDGVS